MQITVHVTNRDPKGAPLTGAKRDTKKGALLVPIITLADRDPRRKPLLQLKPM